MPLQLEPLAPLDDLAALDAAGLSSTGAPLLIALDLIDEDPVQPRTEFDNESLAELAATIAERGVKQPISVRPHPTTPGRWMLNFGARRLRASRLAERAEIPAFVDTALDSYDQVIENEQRKALRPLELALFVKRRLDEGASQAEIARRMGKSTAYVSYIASMIDAPDWLMQVYRNGRCRGIKELHELRRLHAEHPQRVEAWVCGQEQVTRDRIVALRLELSQDSQSSDPACADGLGSIARERDRPEGVSTRAFAAPAARTRPAGLQLMARLDGETAAIVVDTAPSDAARVYVCRADATQRIAVEASRLQLLGFAQNA